MIYNRKFKLDLTVKNGAFTIINEKTFIDNKMHNIGL